MEMLAQTKLWLVYSGAMMTAFSSYIIIHAGYVSNYNKRQGKDALDGDCYERADKPDAQRDNPIIIWRSKQKTITLKAQEGFFSSRRWSIMLFNMLAGAAMVICFFVSVFVAGDVNLPALIFFLINLCSFAGLCWHEAKLVTGTWC